MYSGEHATKRGKGFLRSILSFVGMLALVLVLSFGLRTFVFQAYEIPSGSMERTIMTNDMVFAEKVTYYFEEPAQGDIVTFENPENPAQTLIKRVIATGGQVVDLQYGVVVVDGTPLDEPYTLGKPAYPYDRHANNLTANVTFPYTVPEGYVWVMGDNRTNSNDSRYFGAVPVSSVTSKALFIYWPFSDACML